ncbi:MAG: ParB/RepB/Spo0J family partition protein [Bacillota bacterium]|nr:ParB/RepB/Spo0J family partition protein [Bacillota bacterium]
MPRRGLGKGLSALILEEPVSGKEQIVEIEIGQISPSPNQPRQEFAEESIKELADSIVQYGLVQPIVVRRAGPGYEVVAGERRLRAATLAGLKTIGAVVRELSDADALQIALIENLQREDLNPLEEAEAYRRLVQDFGLTQDGVADRVAKSRPQVANILRLLQLEPQVQEMVRRDKLSAGHARALLALDNPTVQRAAAERMVEKGLSVREAEAHVSALIGRGHRVTRARQQKARDAEMIDVEARLRAALGTTVRITGDSRRGKLEIHYFSAEELERVVEAILLLSREAAATDSK